MIGRAAELRAAFDREFSIRPPAAADAHRDFLCIRSGGEPFAIPLGDIASLHADHRVVALPTREPALLGVAAIRAAIVPIYDLGVALGLAGSAAARWIALVGGGAAGFAFEGHDGHARIAERAIAAARRGHVRGQVVVDGTPRPIVELASVLAEIEARWHPGDAARNP